MKYFHFYSKEEILRHTRIRKYETKLGEKIGTVNLSEPLTESLKKHNARYVIFGIQEDIGIRANCLRGTEKYVWKDFIDDFLNLQVIDAFSSDEILLLGVFDFSEVESLIEVYAKDSHESIDALRHAVANIVDEEVEAISKVITASGKIPIVIGGGQNNAYPLMKGSAKGLNKAGVLPKPVLNANSLDLDCNFKLTEGRHSGNGFRYAMEESYLAKYAITGLHEYINPQSVIDDIYSNIHIQYISNKEIFVDERLNFRQAIAQNFAFTEDGLVGLHINVNAISYTGSEKSSSTEISSVNARQFVCYAANFDVAYLHLSEGNGISPTNHIDAAKLLSILVMDYIVSRA
ncbi:MAG: arginase family protein [Chitinophagaceae bacterium]